MMAMSKVQARGAVSRSGPRQWGTPLGQRERSGRAFATSRSGLPRRAHALSTDAACRRAPKPPRAVQEEETAVSGGGNGAAADVLHPLDPITADEIRQAVRTVKASSMCALPEAPGAVRFNTIDAIEPEKKAMLAAAGSSSFNGATTHRRVEVKYQIPSEGRAYVAVVATADRGASELGVLESCNELVGVQPLLTPDDCFLAEAIVKGDDGVLTLLSERYGMSKAAIADQVTCDPWSIHCAGGETFDTSKRLVQTFLYLRRDGEFDNAYAHPLDALPVVDLDAGRVVHVEVQGSTSAAEAADGPAVPSAAAPYNYHPSLLDTNALEGSLSTFREGKSVPKPLEIVQPEGPSFEVKGQHVTWDKWSLRVGFNHREGLVLHDVHFDGKPVCYRASLVEMAVPYADPETPFQRKCAFDVGDYGLGYCTDSLSLGCDCLGQIHYFDATLSDHKGEPYDVKKAVCMHEEDDGVLWKHVEYRTGHNQSRRSRKLVLSFICTVVNYEYLFYYYLKQDGSLSLEIKLSGMLSTNYMLPGTEPEHGTIVAPSVNAQVHQHMFCARLDMAVGGNTNSVAEVDVRQAAMDAETNPYGNVFKTHTTVLKTEKEAIREAAPELARSWRIFNPDKINPISNKPIGYKLLPFTFGPAQPLLLTHPDSAVAKRGAFAQKSLWVTPHQDGQYFPAGEYTVQSEGGEGLPAWVAGDRSVENEDIVLYHSFGVCHVPRPEDFPVMPCESTGFMLKPDSFLSGNPGIDLPPDQSSMSKCNQCE